MRSLRWAALSALLLCQSGCGRPDAPAAHVKQVFHLQPYEQDLGYSQAVLIGKTLYISGALAVDEAGHALDTLDLGGQLQAAYDIIKRTLHAHGAGFDAVVKETIYTTDMDALLKAADLRFEYYAKDRLPATSWVEVRRLTNPKFLVQIDIVAELP